MTVHQRLDAEHRTSVIDHNNVESDAWKYSVRDDIAANHREANIHCGIMMHIEQKATGRDRKQRCEVQH